MLCEKETALAGRVGTEAPLVKSLRNESVHCHLSIDSLLH